MSWGVSINRVGESEARWPEGGDRSAAGFAKLLLRCAVVDEQSKIKEEQG